LMELMSSCIFLSQVLNCLTSSSVFPSVSISSSSSEILSSLVLVCWSGLPFCFVFLFHSFFWGFPYHGSLPLKCYQFSALIHLSLYLWCPLFHCGIYLGILWVHLIFLCLIIVFIFIVLEFLECLLYFMVDLV
jgi:hypothetical protein